MARKKDPPKPISSLRFDFVDSLENVCQQALLLMQAVDVVLNHDSLPSSIAEMLTERAKAMRAALIADE